MAEVKAWLAVGTEKKKKRERNNIMAVVWSEANTTLHVGIRGENIQKYCLGFKFRWWEASVP